jgi:hypothetical protein
MKNFSSSPTVGNSMPFTKTGQGCNHLPELLVAMSVFRVSVLLGYINVFVEAANKFQCIQEPHWHPEGEE